MAQHEESEETWVPPALTIYHLEGRRSLRVIWSCEELGIPYKVIFTPGDLQTSMAELRSAHPLMPVAPTVRLGTTFMVESGAILDVLVHRYGNGMLVPAVDSEDYLFHAQWSHFAEGTAMARLVTERMMSLASGIELDRLPLGYHAGAAPETPAPVGPLAVFDFMEHHMKDHPYFGGHRFTTADIMMHTVVRLAKIVAGIDSERYEHIARWTANVESREAFQRAMKAALPSGVDAYWMPNGLPYPFAALPPERLRPPFAGL